MARQVYIVGAYIPNGGTLMAYHLGLIVAEHVGGEPISVRVATEEISTSLFSYPRELGVIDLDKLLSVATVDDILIMNPSFSSLCLGHRFPGFKLMYVQGYSTFDVIDRWFDSYVSSSGFVNGFLHYVYNLSAPIIYPFIDTSEITHIPEWTDRSASRILVLTKGNELQQMFMLESIERFVHKERPDVVFERATGRISRADFLKLLATYRYALSLSCAEGFGLVPLESMVLGATLVGFDAGGGRSYMRDGDNCWCASYPDIARLADRLLFSINNPDIAQGMAVKSKGSREFTYERFRSQWTAHLRHVLP